MHVVAMHILRIKSCGAELGKHYMGIRALFKFEENGRGTPERHLTYRMYKLVNNEVHSACMFMF